MIYSDIIELAIETIKHQSINLMNERRFICKQA